MGPAADRPAGVGFRIRSLVMPMVDLLLALAALCCFLYLLAAVCRPERFGRT
jgi:hypothetical protein